MKTLFTLLIICYGGSIVYAQTAISPAAGDGSETQPYEISSLENLYWIAADTLNWDQHYIQTADIDATPTNQWFEGKGWQPIGNLSTPFSGSYNGQGYTIDGIFFERMPDFSLVKKYGIYSKPLTLLRNENKQSLDIENKNMDRYDIDEHVGFFGKTDGADLSNIGLTSMDISGIFMVGGLVGYNINSTIINCYTTGSLKPGWESEMYFGGLVGQNLNSTVLGSYSEINFTDYAFEFVGGLVGANTNSQIIDSYSAGNVIGGWFAGGLVGWSQDNSLIKNSFSTSSVHGQQHVGGLVGNNSENSAIKNSYFTGTVDADYNYVGGLVGTNNGQIDQCYSDSDINGYGYVAGFIGINQGVVSNNYSTGSVSGEHTIGGFIGDNTGDVIHCFSNAVVSGSGDHVGGFVGASIGLGKDMLDNNNYWDTETSGYTESVMGIGRTTQEMTFPYAENTFAEWNFDSIWGADVESDINYGYPYLRWQIGSPEPVILQIKVIVEGAYTPGKASLMHTQLLTGDLLPLYQPFAPELPYFDNEDPVWYYPGDEEVVVMPGNVVDWVLLELRDAPTASQATTSLIRKAALLLDNGMIVNVEGLLPVFDVVIDDSLFVVVYHRNHLPVMSSAPLTADEGVYSWDFTQGAEKAFGKNDRNDSQQGHKNLGEGIFGMFGGDGDGSGQIQTQDKNNVWNPQSGQNGYHAGDFDLNGQVQTQDKNNIWNANSGIGSTVPETENKN